MRYILNMNSLKQRLLNIINQIKAYLPSRLPVGVTAFDSWASDIIALANAPDNETVRGSLAAMVINGSPFHNAYPKRHFVKQLQTAMAKQVAGHVFTEIKEQQRAAEQAKLEATKLQVVSNAPPSQNP